MNNNFKKITTASYIVASLALASCELLNPPLAAKLPLPPVKHEKQDDQLGLESQVKKPVEAPKLKTELYPGTDRFVSDAAQQHRRTQGSGEGSYSLNFDEADLGEVAKVILGDILGQNYVLSPKVAGKVTLQTTEALTKEELLPTLEMVLRMNNAALVKDGKIYHIEPTADALYSSNISSANQSGFQTRVFPIRYVAVEDIVEIIKPLVNEKTILKVEGGRNILIASGTADEMARVLDLIGTFDIDMLRGRSFALFPLTHVEPDTITKELEEVFNNSGKAEEGDFFKFITIDRLNAILAITHQARYLRDIESWIARLDRANTASSGGVNVYRVQNVDAEDLAGTLNDIFTGSGGSTKKEKAAKVSPGQNAAELTNKQPTEKQNIQKTSSASRKSSSSGEGQLKDVKIIADPTNNSIVIVATPQEYETILPVIKQLDAVPLQVLIDATVAAVTLTDELIYGIEWFIREGNTAIGSGLSKVSLGGLATDGLAAFATGGLSVVQNSGTVKAILSAQAKKDNVKIISSPSLMVLNNQQAKINVGDQIPIQTSSLTNAVSSNGISADPNTNNGLAQASQIQYKDTGVTLDVKPRVNANGMVILEIHQIVSSVKETSVGVTSSATIEKQEIESSVAVKDGETIALGGLIKEDNTANKAGIPFLHELPWIGPLFGNTTYKKNRKELVVLITPRVVTSKQDSRDISNEFKRKLTGIYQEVPAYFEKPTTN
ncbi:MAG: type II secretion system secretin GspD [Methylococcaceae bacterium]|nr:type II secretion system secretin GspD [Methylococcaceae bacterium]